MARLGQVQLEILGDLRLDRAHVAGEEGLRLRRVQLAQDGDRQGQVVGAVAHARGQLGEDADHLAPLLVLQLDDVVVELDRGQGLHEHALRPSPSCRGRCPGPGRVCSAFTHRT